MTDDIEHCDTAELSFEEPLFPAGMALDFGTSDFDEIAGQLQNWDLSFRQVQRGLFSGRLAMSHTASLQCIEADFRRGVGFEGMPAPDSYTFMLHVEAGDSLRLCHRPLGADKLVAIPPNYEIVGNTQEPVRVLVVSVDTALFEHHINAVCGKPLGDRTQILDLSANKTMLAQRWQSLLDLAVTKPEELTAPIRSHIFEEAFLSALTDTLVLPARSAPLHRRVQLARKAREFLHEHAANSISLADMCRAVGASERSLHLCFQECFGMSPKSYLKVLRLNGVRRALMNAGPYDTISRIASCWGFLHFGWFSVDYRRLFGETPSETIAKARLLLL